MTLFRIEHYLRADGRGDPYMKWLSCLSDRQAKQAVIRQVGRFEQGHFGDHRFCRDGVWELRVGIRPGYRIYFVPSRLRYVLLLCGGDKSTQSADIKRAISFWQDWQRRKAREKHWKRSGDRGQVSRIC